MGDPTLERLKRQVAEEFSLPLDYFEQFLELEEEKVHYARRHGLSDDLLQLVVRTASALESAE